MVQDGGLTLRQMANAQREAEAFFAKRDKIQNSKQYKAKYQENISILKNLDAKDSNPNNGWVDMGLFGKMYPKYNKVCIDLRCYESKGNYRQFGNERRYPKNEPTCEEGSIESLARQMTDCQFGI